MFVRRLAEPNVMIDGVLALRHRLDRHDSFVGHLRRRVAAKLAERPFVAGLRRDRQLTFEHDLRKRRHFKIDGPAFDDIHRLAGEAAGDLQLENPGPRLELRSNVNRRRYADANGDFEFFLAALLSVLNEIVAIMPGCEANGYFVLRYQHHSVDRKVVAVLRISDDHVARRDVWPAVPGIVRAKRQLRDIDPLPSITTS